MLERGGFGKDLNKVPAAACWDYAEIPLSMDAVGRLWVFEVGERSEVGALESPTKKDYAEIPWETRNEYKTQTK